jgi:hypothetical protein
VLLVMQWAIARTAANQAHGKAFAVQHRWGARQRKLCCQRQCHTAKPLRPFDVQICSPVAISWCCIKQFTLKRWPFLQNGGPDP